MHNLEDVQKHIHNFRFTMAWHGWQQHLQWHFRATDLCQLNSNHLREPKRWHNIILCTEFGEWQKSSIHFIFTRCISTNGKKDFEKKNIYPKVKKNYRNINILSHQARMRPFSTFHLVRVGFNSIRTSIVRLDQTKGRTMLNTYKKIIIKIKKKIYSWEHLAGHSNCPRIYSQ